MDLCKKRAPTVSGVYGDDSTRAVLQEPELGEEMPKSELGSLNSEEDSYYDAEEERHESEVVHSKSVSLAMSICTIVNRQAE